MRASVEKSINKVKDALIDNEYQTAKELSGICGLKKHAIHRVIRNMRLSGIGVLTTNKGYVLSEFAKKKDDVNFIRRLYGRRTSDYIALKAAKPDIDHRWKSVAEKHELRLLVQPLAVDLSDSKGMKILLSKSNSKGI